VASTFDIAVKYGATYDGPVIEIVVNDVALDLSQATTVMEICAFGQDAIVKTLSVGAGLEAVDLAKGQFRISPIYDFQLSVGKYTYEVWHNWTATGKTKNYLTGSIVILESSRG